MSKIHQWGGEDISYPRPKCPECRDTGFKKVGEVGATSASNGPTDIAQICGCQETKGNADD